MCANGIVGYAYGYPNNAFASGAASHHLHYPRLIGIAYSECLALAVIAVFLGQFGHYRYGLPCCARTLQAYVNQRTVIQNSGRVNHLGATSECGFCNGDLKLVDVANHIVCHRCLWYLPVILVGIPVIYVAHLSFGVLAGRIMAKVLEHAVVIGTVRTHHRPVRARFLTYYQVCAWQCINSYCKHA